MSHFARQYMGLPWVNGAQGPDEFDCGGFFRFIRAKHFNHQMPIIDVDANRLKAVLAALKKGSDDQEWVKVDTPSEGDAVLMAHAKYPSHIGIWLDADGGGVLHCVRGAGVIYSDLNKLRLTGWGKIEYYRHQKN